MKKYLQLLLILPLMMACTKTTTSDGIVRIGNKTISKAQFDAFEKVTRMYPTDPSDFFPSIRSKISHIIETDVIFQQSAVRALKDSLKNTTDWQWKKRYFPAQMFLIDYLSENLGIPDDQINSYYEAHKDSFKVIIKVDSTKKDSVYYKPLADVKSSIADSLFIQSEKPDSLFLSRFDTIPEKQELNIQWVQYVRQNLPTYFMKKIYKEMTSTPYPDSLTDIFGEGKYITQADMDVIMAWIPETRRHFYAEPERKRELVEWLVKWKLFSGYAEKLGRNKLPAVKHAMEWAWKLNVVYAYVSSVLEPQAASSVSIDSTMLLYAMFDDNGYTISGAASTHALEAKIMSTKHELKQMKIDSTIIGYRQKYPITFLQNDWKDIKTEQPAAMLTKADALRDSGKSSEARDAYLTLTKEFVFTPEGQTSLIELAKLQTEQQLYTQAINNYRKYLILSPDRSKRCNTFFMIGFIYDEYLDKPLNAEANYKWVLKNSPECELADDAEFMMLHLSEPMSSVEELRDEAQRQGRKVDPVEEDVSMNDTATAASATETTAK